jgi:N-acetylmuramoyl-L-alanine amidase
LLAAVVVAAIPANGAQVASPPKPLAAKAGALVPVRSISRTSQPHGERVIVEFFDEVSFSGERVASPDRVYLDFPGTQVTSVAIANARAVAAGSFVDSVRIAQHSEQTTRVVVQLNGHPRYSVYTLYSPFRVVINVEPSGSDEPAPAPQAASQRKPAASPTATNAAVPTKEPKAPAASNPSDTNSAPLPLETVPAPPTPTSQPTVDAPTGAAPADQPAATSPAPEPPAVPRTPLNSTAAPPAATNSKGDYSLARQLGLGVARIVIDAGHGGHDPGAQSNGIAEAELVLDVALRLEKLLVEQRGITVVLTRRTDDFIPLEERTAIANRECADLFLSIHANASQIPAARGIETYFLNFTTNPAAEAVAARENATSTMTMNNLPDLVKTIAMNSKVVESRELATFVQSAMLRRLRLQNKTVKDLGVKQAAFVVLIGAQMPSVLAEISFVTNKSEAALLKQGAYRQRIAQALMEGLLKYQTSLKKVSVADAGRRED